MNKIRLLNDNTILDDNASVAGAIYEYQRLLHGAVTGGAFSVGDPVNGTVSGNKGGIISGVGDGYIDVALVGDVTGDSSLPEVNFYAPNNDFATTETIDNLGGVSATTTAGYRIPVYHPDFPETNYKDTNRNKIIPAKGYYQLDERNFKKLKTTVVYTNPVQISCIAILNHNLSDTATIELHVIDDTATEIYNVTITNPNQTRFSTANNYNVRNGQTNFTEADRNSIYKNSNIFLLYLPAEYTVGELEIDVVDTSNTNSYIYTGSIYAGTYYEVSTNMDFGWSSAIIDRSETVYAQSPFSTTRQPYTMISMNFNNVSSDERSFWQDLYMRTGIHKDFIIHMFNGSTDANDNIFSYYCRFAEGTFEMVNSYRNRYSFPVLLRESI